MGHLTGWLGSIRGQLVTLYLAVLAVVLLGLGAFQTVQLQRYMSNATADSMRQAARAELSVLSACFIKNPSDLRQHAVVLAQLLGTHDVAAKIVSPTAQTLADHAMGPPGAGKPLQLSASTIRQLIRSVAPTPTEVALRPPSCHVPQFGFFRGFPRQRTSGVQEGDMLLIAVPLGPRSNPAGYAILGRSTQDATATVHEAQATFALGGIAALLLAALVALPLINRALRPLRRVTRTAEAIASGDLEQRANLRRSVDEIGRLGKSFDAMVDRLQQALAASTASEERMRQFLADASHELRTPLTALRGTSQVLLRQRYLNEEEVRTGLAAVHDESVRLSRLVDDLLTLSRLDAGQELDPRPVQIHSFLTEFVERYAPAWPTREIRVDASSLNGERAFVDSDALRRVITNLVDNAARYSTPGRPITLAARPDDHHVAVEVRDEGPGLTPEDATRVFERFYRANKSRSRQLGGSGLGLAIVQALVDESDGKVTLDTGPNRGTTVTVTLPRVMEQEPAEMAAV